MTRKTLRQAVKALAHALDDPRFDDWDDEMILVVLGEIITTHRRERDRMAIFNLHGSTVMSGEQMDEMIDKLGAYLRDNLD